MDYIARMVKEAVEAVGDDEQVSFYNGYSGRGMYGSECVGITGSKSECMKLIAEVIKLAHEASASDDEVEFDDVVDCLLDYEQDSMGRSDVIIYWRQLNKLTESEPEHDGQPDEAQEWHDFDPDC